MNKSRTWQIVSLVLLVLAIIAVLLFNNKLNASKESLSSTIAQLNEEQKNSAALQADLDAAKADYEGVNARLEEEQARTVELSAEVENGKTAAEKLNDDLTAANDRVTELETAAAESEEKIAELETAVSEKQEAIAGLQEAAGEAEAKITELETAVAEKEETIETLNAAIAESEQKALAPQITGVLDELENMIDRLAGLKTEGGALSEAAGELDVSALQDEIAGIADADPSQMSAGERLAALEAIRDKLTETAPELTQEPESDTGTGADSGTTPDTGAAPDADAKAESGEALAKKIAELETAIVDLAGLQAGEGEAPEAVAAIDLDAVREEIAEIVEDTSEEMTDERREAALDAVLQWLTGAMPEQATGEDAAEGIEAIRSRLDAAEAEVEQLSASLADKLSDIDALNAAIAELDAQAETDAEKLAALQDQLSEAEADAQAQRDALTQAVGNYEKSLAEMSAYKLDREPASGEAHLATAVGNVIQVEPDGVTAAWHYSNSDLSGNSAVIALTLDGETIYTSDVLKPGEDLGEITLSKPLAPGEYQGIAVTTVYDEAGEKQLTSRVPVTLSVAG